MSSDSAKFTVKSKIWIENEEGKVVFGAGRLKILHAVERNGSLHAASAELQMSYRAVWGKIKATEDRLGRPLLSKRSGGIQGGGSELTPFARALINRFQHLDELIRTTADTLFEGLFIDTLPESQEETGKESAK